MTPESVIVTGDCVEVMATLDAESVDAIVTDPPYGLGFMGKEWDSPGGLGDVPMRRRHETNMVNTGLSRQGGRQRSTDAFAKRQRRDMQTYQATAELWAEAMLRVAKPGAHLLAFGGTRTVHRLACAIEDAGWEIRDCLVWAYASGFPKSLNLGNGWGTALKPAWEPIVMARKPLRGTVAANVAAFGTGALNIEGTRIAIPPGDIIVGGDFSSNGQGEPVPLAPGGYDGHYTRRGEASAERRYADHPGDFSALPGPRGGDAKGRWPANVILTDPIFDGDTPGVVGGGETASGLMKPTVVSGGDRTVFGQDALAGYTTIETYGDSGTYSRFFLIPKADRTDREPVLRTDRDRIFGDGFSTETKSANPTKRHNVHPTVKPTELMRHLVRLVTPAGGLVLDPFLGSGTTAVACELEGFRWLGIEREAEYVAIAEARLNGTQRGMGLSA